MRLLFVVYGSIETLSGGYLYDRMLIRTLEARGHRVKVLSQRVPSGYLASVWQNHDDAFVRAAREFDPDLVLEDELNHASLFVLNRRLRAALGVPLVALVHHLRQLEARGAVDAWLARVFERRFLRGMDGFLFNSRFTQTTVQVALGRREARTPQATVIALPGNNRWGGRAPERIEAAPPRAGLRILFLGNVVERKGLLVLVGALARLSARHPNLDWQLGIAGNDQSDPAYTTRVTAAIAENGLGARVKWWGPVADEALPGVFGVHDVLAVPSQCEGFGIVYAEALSFGLPVIAGSYGGAAEIVDEGKTGFLVPWGDEGLLATRLAALGLDPVLLKNLGEAARVRAAELPGWEESMVKASAFLESVARR